MQITRVTVHPVSVRRIYVTQIASEEGGAEKPRDRCHFLFLEAQTDAGLTGWGELSDIDAENLPADLKQYEELVSKFLVGRDPYDLQTLHRTIRSAFPTDPERPPLLKATETAVDLLCYDLQGQAAKVPVYKLLGGAQRKKIHISWVAYIREELDLLKEEIHAKRAAGFTAFKLKVGVDIDLDEERLAVLRETAGPQANLKIDPNGGWDLDEARKNIPRLGKFKLAGVETPLAGRKAVELATLRKEVQVPLIEHVASAADALEYIKLESLDYFNIATTNNGGIWPCRVIAQMAQTAGVGLLLGSTVEMGPGTLGQVHLGAAVHDLSLPSDLIGPGMYRDDVLQTRLYYDKGHLLVPDAPGLGIAINRDKLKAL